MTDSPATPETLAPWLVAGAMGDGIDLWLSGEVVFTHGPSAAREKWAPTMRSFRPLLVAYLALEAYPGEAR